MLATNSDGLTGTISTVFLVDTIPPVVTVDPMTPDNIVNLAESHNSIFITGTSEPGVSILVSYNNQQYMTKTDAQGIWSIELPPDALSGMSNEIYTLTAVATDSAGNSASQSVTMALVPPSPTIDLPFDDDILNSNDVNHVQQLRGVTNSYGENQTVVVNIGGLHIEQYAITQRNSSGKWEIRVDPEAGGHTYIAQVDVNGNWVLDLPPEILQQLDNGTTTITVVAADGLGNYGVAPQKNFYVDTIPPILTLDPIAIDNIISGPESLNPLVITGSYADLEIGQPITLVLNGITYTTIADGSGLWSIEIPSIDLIALPQGETDIILSASDLAKNNSTQTKLISVDTQIFLTVAPVAGDDIINAAEAASPIVVRGTADAADSGRIVTVTLEGTSYTTTVQSDGTWSLSIPSADITALVDGPYDLSVTQSDAAGNSITVDHTITLSAGTANLPTLSVDPVTADDIVSANESQSDLTVSGGSSHLQQGQMVTVTINNIDYTGTAGANGSWSVTVPAADVQALSQGSVAIAVKAQDIAGNPASTSDSFMVDTLVNLTVGVVAGDDIINAAEAGAPVVVSGTADVADSGQIVTVTLEGTSYTTTV
ncbi:Ig-like domain-containing protein [Limnobaculum zhutongyuii]|uniref:Ig-like domain-containing protein n=1 Tax=Limnobaculum zhutongyuii TaxID=2498113 RepID=A0A411WGF4_9GAMM|nr:Ig-like domain-containing protein [Limnobaculum zhutongyuii]TQS89089.1 Ig-like domain-containing protein [Limnobaculum zhutongyuii]